MKKLILALLMISNLTFLAGVDSTDVSKRVDSLIAYSDAQRDSGLYDACIVNLVKAEVLVDSFNLKLIKPRIINRFSNIFMLKKDYNKALDYAKISLKLSIQINDSNLIGIAYAKIGDVLSQNNKYNEAEINYKNSIKYFNKPSAIKTKVQLINSLGLLYQSVKKYKEAEKLLLEAYNISKEINYILLTVYIEVELGDLFLTTKDYNKSKYYFELALKNEKKVNYVILSQNLYYRVHLLYKAIGECDKSLKYADKYSILTDSLNLINQDQRILETETKFRTKEKEKEIVFLNKESELQQSQIKRGRIIIGLSFVVIFIVGGLVVFIQKARKKQATANQALADKNTEIEHQKKEIVDSINYAKRIQNASLGNPKKIKELYKDSAILFQPKDILSGDFYWFSK